MAPLTVVAGTGPGVGPGAGSGTGAGGAAGWGGGSGLAVTGPEDVVVLLGVALVLVLTGGAALRGAAVVRARRD